MTIEATIAAILAILRRLGPVSEASPKGLGLIETVPDPGSRLPPRMAPRKSPPLADIDAAIRHLHVAVYPRGPIPAPLWFDGFLCTAVFTALRLGDLLSLREEDLEWEENRIQVVARKTGKIQWLPMPPALAFRLRKVIEAKHAAGSTDPVVFATRNMDPHLMRMQLREVCKAAGVPHFSPQGIRRRAATEYERAKPGAGGLLLGHTLRSMTFQHYISAFEILCDALATVGVPEVYKEPSWPSIDEKTAAQTLIVRDPPWRRLHPRGTASPAVETAARSGA